MVPCLLLRSRHAAGPSLLGYSSQAFNQLAHLRFLAVPSPQRTGCCHSSVATALQDLVTTGRLKQDDSQSFAAKVLNVLQGVVKNSGQHIKNNIDGNQTQDQATACQASEKPAALPFPRGAYLWGTIGSGKTMLLDLFCSSFSDADQIQFGLCRLHFHEFMLNIHGRLHSLQESLPRIRGQSQFGLPVFRHEVAKTVSESSASLLHMHIIVVH